MNMSNWSVYKHTCPNGKVYIGITSKPPKSRWNSGYGYCKCKRFWNAIVKYGWNNIDHDILYVGLTKSEAETIEKRLIAECHSTDPDYGYNIMPGGDVTQGFPAWNKGLPKELQPNYGKPMSLEQRMKIAKTLSKPIVCVETDTLYESTKQASKELGVQFSNISRCLHGRCHTAGGYHWRWAI
jgi:hypothetical protein